MTAKNILIVTRAFYPEIGPRSFRATELSAELARQGNNVTVAFPANGYDYSSFLEKHALNGSHLRILDLGRLRWRDFSLEGEGAWNLVKRAMRRVLQLLFEYPDIEMMFRVARKLRNEKGYDLMISIATPHPVHWGVAAVRTKNRRIAGRWVADCGDPFMGDRMDSFRKMFYFSSIEKWFCRKADFITVPFTGAVEAYYPEFHNKIRIIPQGFRLRDLELPEYSGKSDISRFAYSGTFIPGKRDPRKLLEYLVAVDRDYEFTIFTSQKELVEPFTVKLGNRLKILDPVRREELLKVLAKMDFLINLDNNVIFQLPSKLIDYAIVRRPVLNIAKIDDIKLLEKFMDGDYSGKMILMEPDHYDIESVAKKFLALA